ncbi:MAG: phosphoethanolamine transferase [Muribaculaceae bacterium]|nr:phosphoethanolamine transferase [Muribaculaceae bacterium]
MKLLRKWYNAILNVTPNRNLWFVLTVISLMSLADFFSFFSKYEVTKFLLPGEVFYPVEICFAIFKATVLTYLYALLRKWRGWRIALICLFVIYGFLSCVNLFSSVFYSRGISRSFFLTIFETNAGETTQFMSGLWYNIVSLIFSLQALIIYISLGVAYCLIRWCSLKWFKRICFILSTFGFISLLGMIFIVSQIGGGRLAHFMLARTPVYACQAYNAHRSAEDALKYMKPLPYPQTAKTKALAEDVILVIGESSSMAHNSLYGYPINTNPKMSLLKDSLAIFTDAIGSSSSTADNMPRILTFMPDTILDDWYNHPSLIQLFKHLGYRTYWLSNQEKAGDLKNSSSSIASVADEIHYTGAIYSEDRLTSNFDGVLMPHLHKALSDDASRRLIMLHLMGSHTWYRERYPSEAQVITADEEIRLRPRKWLNANSAQICADYDNSIRYTDELLYRMVREISSSPRPSLLIYFSDHGEGVYDDGDFIVRSVDYVRVPCWIYMNKAYRDANPAMFARLQRVAGDRFSTSSTIHMLLTLTGSKYKLYDPQLDILNKRYNKTRKRYVDEHPFPYDK